MSNLTPESSTQLSEFLYYLSQFESEIESNRINLCQNPTCSIQTCFNLIDRLGIGYLSLHTIQDFLDKHEILHSPSSVLALISQYTTGPDTFLTIDEFQHLILPSTCPGLLDSVLSRGHAQYTGELEYLLGKLLGKEVEMQRNLEIRRKELYKRYDFSSVSAFEAIDWRKRGFIDRGAIFEYCKRNGRVLGAEDVDGILRRIDLDGDELLSFSELCEYLRPKEPIFKGVEGDKRGGSGRERGIKGNDKLNFLGESVENFYEVHDILYVLTQQLRIEKFLDSSKINLISSSDFNLADNFKLFDKQNLGFINEFELEDTLMDLGVRPLKEEINLLFQHYSSSKKFSFTDFSHLFLPIEPEYEIILDSRLKSPKGRSKKRFSEETHYNLGKLLKIHLESEGFCENLRQGITRKAGFSIYEAFKQIDQDHDGFITEKDLQLALDPEYEFLTPTDLKILILRYDLNNDGKISYSEFLEEITPKLSSKL